MGRAMSSVCTALLLVAGSAFAHEGAAPRRARGSSGAYSGVINGQFYGGSYRTPDEGPTVFNRFGEHPVAPPTYAPQFPFGLGASPSGHGAPPFRNPFEFEDFFQNYFRTLNGNLALAFAKNSAYQRAAFEAAQQAYRATAAGHFGGGGGGGGGGWRGGAGASAAASVGPGGSHHVANIYPENSSSPNVNSRFGPHGSPGGSYGVSSSSFSSSSDVNGKKSSHKQATTTVNDNGRVTSYTVRD